MSSSPQTPLSSASASTDVSSDEASEGESPSRALHVGLVSAPLEAPPSESLIDVLLSSRSRFVKSPLLSALWDALIEEGRSLEPITPVTLDVEEATRFSRAWVRVVESAQTIEDVELVSQVYQDLKVQAPLLNDVWIQGQVPLIKVASALMLAVGEAERASTRKTQQQKSTFTWVSLILLLAISAYQWLTFPSELNAPW
jgi:hypothetical protein